MIDKYDAILFLIPFIFAKASAISYIFSFPMETSIPVAGTASLLIVLYGLFIDPPIRPSLSPHH